jgi:hypothetical protein
MITHDGPWGLMKPQYDMAPKVWVEEKKNEDENRRAEAAGEGEKRRRKSSKKEIPEGETVRVEGGLVYYDFLNGKDAQFYVERSIDLLILVNQMTLAAFQKLKDEGNDEKLKRMGISVEKLHGLHSLVPYVQVRLIEGGTLSYSMYLVRCIVSIIGFVCTDTHCSES